MSLPKTIDPWRLIKKHAELIGDLPLREFPRLQAMHDQGAQMAHVELFFQITKEGVPLIKGKVQATLQLICERCNDAMEYKMEQSIMLSPVKDDEAAKRLPGDIDPLLLTETDTVLAQIIEDEILLNLPMVTKHDDAHCTGALSDYLK